ncbi:hypothetical protein [Bacillus sp. ISL-55]|uniref:hypothetical protein n=1 Tax=Bacillus sp. ISL-55 TaxID=2819134 RepID=UPI001BEB6432|nr:hypothetical protein [Bacillus sp. ISL-55]MBT2692463.1 hypothetical protein [Bacillus sp. ISL-55]
MRSVMTVKERWTPTIVENALAAHNLSPYFVYVHENSIIITIDEGGTQLFGYKYFI